MRKIVIREDQTHEEVEFSVWTNLIPDDKQVCTFSIHLVELILP